MMQYSIIAYLVHGGYNATYQYENTSLIDFVFKRLYYSYSNYSPHVQENALGPTLPIYFWVFLVLHLIVSLILYAGNSEYPYQIQTYKSCNFLPRAVTDCRSTKTMRRCNALVSIVVYKLK